MTTGAIPERTPIGIPVEGASQNIPGVAAEKRAMPSYTPTQPAAAQGAGVIQNAHILYNAAVRCKARIAEAVSGAVTSLFNKFPIVRTLFRVASLPLGLVFSFVGKLAVIGVSFSLGLVSLLALTVASPFVPFFRWKEKTAFPKGYFTAMPAAFGAAVGAHIGKVFSTIGGGLLNFTLGRDDLINRQHEMDEKLGINSSIAGVAIPYVALLIVTLGSVAGTS